MKKVLFSFCILIGSLQLRSQSTGFSVAALAYHPQFNTLYAGGNFEHMHYLIPGMRIEWNSFPRGFYGIGVDYFFPVLDSANPNLGAGSMLKRSTFDAMLRGNFSISQEFDEFLTLTFGCGFGYTSVREEIIKPASGISPRITAHPGFTSELSLGALYELARFYIFTQLSYMYTTSELISQTKRTGISMGIYLPFRKK